MAQVLASLSLHVLLLNWAASWKLVFIWWGQADKGFLMAGLFLVPRAQWGTVPSSVKSPSACARFFLLFPLLFSRGGTRQPFSTLAWSLLQPRLASEGKTRRLLPVPLPEGSDTSRAAASGEPPQPPLLGETQRLSAHSPHQVTAPSWSRAGPSGSSMPVSPMPALPSSTLACGYCPGPRGRRSVSIHGAPLTGSVTSSSSILALRSFQRGHCAHPGTPGAQGFLGEWRAGKPGGRGSSGGSVLGDVQPWGLLAQIEGRMSSAQGSR